MHLQQLRTIITQKFRRPVESHYDAQQLQQAIENETGKRLSTQTIKRFFGLIKTASRPDPATLDAFSAYLHFSSYSDFVTWTKLLSADTEQPEREWAAEIVLHVLRDIHPESLHEKGVLQLVKNLFSLFERHPALTATIYPQLAASSFGRRYFFQQFVHYDALGTHYGMGLEYYLLHEDEPADRLFAYAMLCVRDFLVKNDKGCLYYFDKINEFTLSEITGFHPFVVGRYFSSKLFKDAIDGVNSHDYIAEVLDWLDENDLQCEDIYFGFPCAELVFAEALLFTGHFQQAFELLGRKKVREYKHPPLMDAAFKNHLDTLYVFSGLKSGKLTKTAVRKMLPKLQQAPVYFLCTNYSGLFMNAMKAETNIEPRLSYTKAKECLQALAFTRLAFYIEDNDLRTS